MAESYNPLDKRTRGSPFGLGSPFGMGPQAGPKSLMSDLESTVPGLSELLGTGSGVIKNRLSGTESPAIAQNMNAMWGAGAGLAPGTEFLRNRGVDLFGQRAEARQSQGLQDLLGMLGGITQPLGQYRGQNIERELGLENIAQRQREAQLQAIAAANANETNQMGNYLGFLR